MRFRGCPRNPLEPWDAIAGSSIAVFRGPKTTRLDSGGKRKNEARADFRSERNIRLQLQEKVACLWVVEKRYVVAWGICYRWAAGDSFSGRSIPGMVQFRLTAMLRNGGFSANQMAFELNAMDAHVWLDGDGNLEFAQGALTAGPFSS